MQPEVCRSGSAGAPAAPTAQGPAGGQERLRDEDLAVVDHDRVRDDHRPGRGMLQPLVDAESAAGRAAPSGPSAARPPSPGRIGSGTHPGQQHAGVHRLGRQAAAPPRHGAGRDVDRAGQLRPAGHPVVQHHQHIQRRGVDLHRSRPAPTRPPARTARQGGQPATGGCGPTRTCASRPTACPAAGKDCVVTAAPLPRGRGQPPGSARSARTRRSPSATTPARLGDRLPHRLGHPRIRPPGRSRAAGPVVNQPGHAPASSGDAVGDRAGRHRPARPRSARPPWPAPARSRHRRPVILRSRPGPLRGVRRNPARTSTMCRSHHRARATTAGGSPSSPTCAAGPPRRGAGHPLPSPSATEPPRLGHPAVLAANRTVVPAPAPRLQRPAVTRSPKPAGPGRRGWLPPHPYSPSAPAARTTSPGPAFPHSHRPPAPRATAGERPPATAPRVPGPRRAGQQRRRTRERLQQPEATPVPGRHRGCR